MCQAPEVGLRSDTGSLRLPPLVRLNSLVLAHGVLAPNDIC